MWPTSPGTRASILNVPERENRWVRLEAGQVRELARPTFLIDSLAKPHWAPFEPVFHLAPGKYSLTYSNLRWQRDNAPEVPPALTPGTLDLEVLPSLRELPVPKEGIAWGPEREGLQLGVRLLEAGPF